MATAALVLAAGRGTRLGADRPKAFVRLAGEPLIVHSVRSLSAAQGIDWIQVVVPAEDPGLWQEAQSVLEGLAGLLPAVPGGAERQDSVQAGLDALAADVDLVAVHDAARALVRPEDVDRVVAVARAEGAALLAAPARDTIKRVCDGRVQETPPRETCWVAQTPQVFRRELLAEALAKAEAEGFVGTDDAQLVERLGVPVHVVEGDPGNLKITGPEDLVAAEARLVREGGAA
jgi:2-C-methyl-D-erythritol 4-phosphate cytidylyltransferase